jgi:hypothetical protein
MRWTVSLFLGLSLSCGASALPVSERGEARGPSADKLADAYRRFSFEQCDKGGCAEALAASAGDRLDSGPSPRATLTSNPDPEWLVDWDKLPVSASRKPYVYKALALAASMKSWKTQCEEAYRRYDKDLTARLQSINGAIKKADADPNPYDRLAALLALRPRNPNTEPDAFADSGDPVRFRIEEAIFESFEATQRTFVYLVLGYAPKDDLVRTMHQREPRESERDLYCYRASKGGVKGISPSPASSAEFDDVRGVVAPLFIDARARWLEGRPKELADVTRARFKKALLPNPQLPPGVRAMTLTKVREFTRDGKDASALVTLFSERYDGGKLVKIDETIRAKFADWPSGLTLGEGDIVSFWGTEDSMKETTIKSTPELEHLSRATVVYEVETKTGKKLSYF